LTRIFDRWTHWEDQPLGNQGWETLVQENFGTFVIFIGLSLGASFESLDRSLWGGWSEISSVDPRVLSLFGSVPSVWLMGVLGGLFLVNGVLVDRLLERWDPRAIVPMWIRGVRILIGGIPSVGLTVLPLWMAWRRRWPSRAPRARAALLNVGGRSLWWSRVTLRFRGWLGRAARSLMSVKRLGALYLFNSFAVMMASHKLAFPSEPSQTRATVVTILSLVVHVVAWLNMGYWFGVMARRFSGDSFYERRRRLLALLWLVPVPYLAGLGAVGLWVREGRLRQPETLTRALYERGKGLPRVDSWRRLEALLREKWAQAPWWRRWLERPQSLETPQPLPRVNEETVRLCRRKSLALGFEAAFMAIVIVAAARELGLDAGLRGVFVVALVPPFAVAGLGLLWRLWRFFVFWARAGEAVRSSDRDVVVSVLVTSQLAWAGGWIVGSHLARTDVAALGGALLTIGVIGLSLQAGPILLRYVISVPLQVKGEIRREVPWLALFTSFLVGGLSMAKGQAGAGLYAFLFLLATFLSPFWGAVMGGLSVPWLLRPHGLRDLLGGKLPGKRQLVLMGLIATVLMPFGGLASPLWILAKRNR
jgi:hypothetical protein